MIMNTTNVSLNMPLLWREIFIFSQERIDNLEERKTQLEDANAHYRILRNKRDEHNNRRK